MIWVFAVAEQRTEEEMVQKTTVASNPDRSLKNGTKRCRLGGRFWSQEAREPRTRDTQQEGENAASFGLTRCCTLYDEATNAAAEPRQAIGLRVGDVP